MQEFEEAHEARSLTLDKWTDRARRILVLAEKEAARLGHEYVGTEHVLLGMIREGGGIAAGVLESLGVDLAKVEVAIEFIVGASPASPDPNDV